MAVATSFYAKIIEQIFEYQVDLRQKNMSRESSESFVTEIPLRVTQKQEATILVRFGFARQLYNACLGESLCRLNLMRQSKAYQSARYIPKDEEHKKERGEVFGKARTQYAFSEYALHAYAKKVGEKLGWMGSSVQQTVASRAFGTVSRYAFGKGGKPRFKNVGQFDSVEGKQNTVISWNGDAVVWGGLVLPAIFPKEGRKGNDVIQHGLNAKLKYVRLVRRKLNGRNRFYVQLVCEGLPFQKPKTKIGIGTVGVDLGPSTIAIVAPASGQAELQQFCRELDFEQKKIWKLQRKQDRQRRVGNPQNYNEDKTVRKGAKTWNKSGKQLETETKLAEMCRKQAEYRKSLHGQLVNHIFSMGNDVKLEKLSYVAFQKMFGKSVGARAPGMFVSLLKRKAVSAGVLVTEFSTRTTLLSQVCICGEVKKKPLSQRWHTCDCGAVAQRDLFSAFLALCVEGNKLNADLAKEKWQSGMDACLRAALSNLQPAIGRSFPASFGLKRSQSGSPVNFCENKTGKSRNVVASASKGESSEKPVLNRTPRL